MIQSLYLSMCLTPFFVFFQVIDRQAMGDTNELSLQREIEIMKKVDHPNIIALRQVFEDKKHVYLVMELVTGGELFDKIVEKVREGSEHALAGSV